MDTIFGKSLQKSIDTATIDKDTDAARQWLRNKAKNLSRDPSKIISSDRSNVFICL